MNKRKLKKFKNKFEVKTYKESNRLKNLSLKTLLFPAEDPMIWELTPENTHPSELDGHIQQLGNVLGMDTSNLDAVLMEMYNNIMSKSK